MIRPTRRAVLMFSGLLILPWLVLLWRPEMWYLVFDVSALILLVIFTDAALVYPRHRVSIALDAPESAFIGDPIDVRFEIQTGLRLRPSLFEVGVDLSGDAQPELTPNPFLFEPITGPRLLSVLSRQRGFVQIEAVWVRWDGPLGFMEQSRKYPLDRSVQILPNIRAASAAALQFFSRDALFGLKPQPQKGGGTEFDALREYLPGFDIRTIDWKHSARHRKLLIKEYRAERNHPVMLGFDTGHLMGAPLDGVPRLDHAINSGLLLAWHAIRSGDLVGCCAFDSERRLFVMPARGVRAFRYLQQRTTELGYCPDETNFTLGIGEIHARLARRALVILFTDFVDTVTAELLIDNAKRLSRRHLVVFVTLRDTLLSNYFDREPDTLNRMAAAVIAEDFEVNRSIVFDKLQRVGVHCLNVYPSRLAPSLLNKYLEVKQRNLL